MKEDNNYCRKCKKEKSIKDFYKYNLTMCKECKRNNSKIYREKNKYQDIYKNDINLLYSKINYIEILLKEVNDNVLYLKNINITNNYNKEIKTNLENKFDEINNTFDKIHYGNSNIKNIMDKLEDYKNKTTIDNKYEEELKQILEDN